MSNEISKSLDRLHLDLRDLRQDIRQLDLKIDEINEKKIAPLQISKARILAYIAALSFSGGAVGNKIDKIIYKNEDIKIEQQTRGNKND